MISSGWIMKTLIQCSVFFAFAALCGTACFAQETPKAPAPATNAPHSAMGTNALTASGAAPSAKAPKQADVASTNAVFGIISKTDAALKSAVDAHALDEAFKLVGTNGGFSGTVAKVYETRGRSALAVVEFDNDYKKALTAIVRGTNFAAFPVLTNLIGKDVLVTGEFIDFHGAAEIVLEKPEQIKLVQESK